MVGKKTGDRDKADRGFGVHHVQDDASRASLRQVPVVFLAQYAVQPGICAPGVTSESTFWLCGPLAGQHIRRNTRRLTVQKEHRKKQCVDNVAVKTESFLALVGACMAMHSAEARHIPVRIERSYPCRGLFVSYLGAFIPNSCRLRCSFTAIKALLRTRSARLLLEIRNGDMM